MQTSFFFIRTERERTAVFGDVSDGIDLAVKSGACETYGVNFCHSDHAMQAARKKARQTAVLAARFDADCAAEPRAFHPA